MATVVDPQMSAAASSGYVSSEDFERNVKHRGEELMRSREELISQRDESISCCITSIGFHE
eukprot:7385497-Pyramimonas_sp.AAC.1